MSKHRIKALFWLLLLTVLAGVTLTAARVQTEQVIEGLEADVAWMDKGNNLILGDEFVKLVDKKFGPVKGLPVDMVDMRAIEEYLMTNPYIRKADVFLGSSGKLVLHLEQRLPLMRIVDNSGKHWYIDSDTVRMPVSTRFTARVPLVNGDFPVTQDVKQWPVDPLFNVALLLQEDEFMSSLVDQIYVEAADKIWLVPRLGPSRILIGNTNSLEDKADRIQRFYKKALPAAGWDRYSYIDTRFEGQIVAKKRINH